MHKNLAILVQVLSLTLVFGFAASAQTAPAKIEKADDDIIRVESKLVVVPVSVTDESGQPVQGLRKEDFTILEENAVQEIAQISPAENVPLEIALLFDVSSSTGSMFQREQETAAKFLREVMRADDRATIFTIGETPALIQTRDNSEKSVLSVQSIYPTSGYTAFYDSVFAATDYLLKNAPLATRKVVVVISDGEDTNSLRIRNAINAAYKKLGSKIDTLDSKTLYQLTVQTRNDASQREQSRILRSLQNADAVFYSVNPAGGSFQFNKMSRFGQDNLQKFAEATGGTAYAPTFYATNLKDQLQNSANFKLNAATLEKIFRQLANELRAQYLLQYYSDGKFPDKSFVKLAVGLKMPGKFRLRARQGYFVK